MTEYTEDIVEKLAYIRDTFIQEDMRKSPFFGNVDTTNGTSLPELILRGHADFTNAGVYGSSFASGISSTTAPNLLYQKVGANAYTVVPGTTENLASYKELNLSPAVVGGSRLADDMNTLANVYSLCEDKTYNTFLNKMAGSSVQIADYMLAGTGATKTALTSFTFDTSTKTYKNGIRDIETALAKVTAAASVTTSAIPLGRVQGAENSDTQIYTGVLPPGNSTDRVVSIAPIMATSTFESLTRRIPIPAPTAADATLRVECYFKSAGSVSVDAAVYIVVGNQIVQLGTKVSANPSSAATWTKFSAQRTGVMPSDAPIYIMIVNAHNKSDKTLLVTGLDVRYTVGSAQAGGAGGAGGGPFTGATDMFVVRRLLLLYLLMANFFIALKAYDTVNMVNDAATKRLLQLSFDAIRWMNRNMVAKADQVNASVPEISKRVSQQMKRFHELGMNINAVDKIVADGKGQLRNEVDRLENTVAIEKRSSKYAIITVVVFAVLVSVVALVYLIPMDPTVRLGGAAAALLMAALFVLGMRKIYDGNVPEGFVGELVVNLASFNTDNVDIATMKSNFQNAIYKEANEYLSNTIHLALLLQNMRAFGKINHSLERELGFFEVSAQQLDTNTAKVKGTQKIVKLDQIKQRATMTLFMTALIVVCATAFAVIATRDRWPGLTTLILVVAGVILGAAVLFFIMDTSARVRTAGQQRYWNAPNTAGIL